MMKSVRLLSDLVQPNRVVDTLGNPLADSTGNLPLIVNNPIGDIERIAAGRGVGGAYRGAKIDRDSKTFVDSLSDAANKFGVRYSNTPQSFLINPVTEPGVRGNSYTNFLVPQSREIARFIDSYNPNKAVDPLALIGENSSYLMLPTQVVSEDAIRPSRIIRDKDTIGRTFAALENIKDSNLPDRLKAKIFNASDNNLSGIYYNRPDGSLGLDYAKLQDVFNEARAMGLQRNISEEDAFVFNDSARQASVASKLDSVLNSLYYRPKSDKVLFGYTMGIDPATNQVRTQYPIAKNRKSGPEYIYLSDPQGQPLILRAGDATGNQAVLSDIPYTKSKFTQYTTDRGENFVGEQRSITGHSLASLVQPQVQAKALRSQRYQPTEVGYKFFYNPNQLSNSGRLDPEQRQRLGRGNIVFTEETVAPSEALKAQQQYRGAVSNYLYQTALRNSSQLNDSSEIGSIGLTFTSIRNPKTGAIVGSKKHLGIKTEAGIKPAYFGYDRAGDLRVKDTDGLDYGVISPQSIAGYEFTPGRVRYNEDGLTNVTAKEGSDKLSELYRYAQLPIDTTAASVQFPLPRKRMSTAQDNFLNTSLRGGTQDNLVANAANYGNFNIGTPSAAMDFVGLERGDSLRRLANIKDVEGANALVVAPISNRAKEALYPGMSWDDAYRYQLSNPDGTLKSPNIVIPFTQADGNSKLLESIQNAYRGISGQNAQINFLDNVDVPLAYIGDRPKQVRQFPTGDTWQQRGRQPITKEKTFKSALNNWLGTYPAPRGKAITTTEHNLVSPDGMAAQIARAEREMGGYAKTDAPTFISLDPSDYLDGGRYARKNSDHTAGIYDIGSPISNRDYLYSRILASDQSPFGNQFAGRDGIELSANQVDILEKWIDRNTVDYNPWTPHSQSSEMESSRIFSQPLTYSRFTNQQLQDIAPVKSVTKEYDQRSVEPYPPEFYAPQPIPEIISLGKEHTQKNNEPSRNFGQAVGRENKTANPYLNGQDILIDTSTQSNPSTLYRQLQQKAINRGDNQAAQFYKREADILDYAEANPTPVANPATQRADNGEYIFVSSKTDDEISRIADEMAMREGDGFTVLPRSVLEEDDQYPWARATEQINDGSTLVDPTFTTTYPIAGESVTVPQYRAGIQPDTPPINFASNLPDSVEGLYSVRTPVSTTEQVGYSNPQTKENILRLNRGVQVEPIIAQASVRTAQPLASGVMESIQQPTNVIAMPNRVGLLASIPPNKRAAALYTAGGLGGLVALRNIQGSESY